MSVRYQATPALVRAAAEIHENSAQNSVYQTSHSQVVLAGPGSGKTHVLAATVARVLAQEVMPPHAVACVTYSNECVRELRARLRRFGVTDAHNVVITTVHGFCLRHVLMPYARLAAEAGSPIVWHDSTQVATEEQRADLLNQAAVRTLGPDRDAWSVSAWELSFRVQRLRARAIERSGPAWDAEGQAVRNVVTRYERALAANQLVDFEMIVRDATLLVRQHHWVRELIQARFPVLVVDEYQDLGVALDAMVVALVREAGVRLLAVGDADQSIYGFTGTEPALLESLGSRLGLEPVRLRLNYRAGQKLVRASAIALGEERGYKAHSSHDGDVFIHRAGEGLSGQADLACGVLVPEILARSAARSLGEIAVLYASHAEGTAVASAAARYELPIQRIDNGAPYRKTPFARWIEQCAAWCASHAVADTDGGLKAEHVPRFASLVAGWVGGVLFERNAAPDVLDAHRLLLADVLFSVTDPAEPFSGWLERLSRGFVDVVLPSQSSYDDVRLQLKSLQRLADDGPLASATVASFGRQLGSPHVLNLVTLHSAKGLEFDSVVLVGLDEGILPRWDVKTAEAFAEARRLFYVGLTRARHEVHLVYSGFTEDRYGRRRRNGPSRFLVELQRQMDDDA